ncbi:MAG: Gldg family protein [Acidobacteriota bacterium]|nr:MAG: Gldg family protein [Acidobacteriota bacterium]
MDSKKRSLSLTVTLGLIALNLVAFNYLIAGWTTARVDLTEEGLYSISPATRRLLGSLDDELTIYGYFSKRTHPKLSPLVPEIVDLLDEYRAISRDRVYVELIDPGENEAAEQEAADRFGVQSTPFRLASKYESGIVNAYFALVIRYGDQYVRYGFDDLIEIEPTPDGDIDVRLRNLEYDLTRAIKKVVYGFRSTAELFERIEEPVRLTVIMTPDAMPELFQDVPQAVRLAAEELKEAGGDKFTYEEFDPSDDEQQQDDLMRLYGARPMSLGLFGDESFYLYGFLETGRRLEQLVLTAEEVTAATIREAIESSLRRLTPGFLKTVGVVAPTPSIPPEVMMQLQMQGRMPPQPPPEFEQVKRVLSQDYQVRDVNLDAAVPVEIDTLLVLKPTDLAERDVYHLDQYLMRGGRVIVCVGNYETQFDPSGLRVAPVTTGLDGWLEHFGVEVPRTLVLDDRNQPLPVPELRRTPLGTLRTWRMAPYPYLVEVREDGLAERSITARLDAVGVYWASPITLDEDKSKELEVLPVLRSSG